MHAQKKVDYTGKAISIKYLYLIEIWNLYNCEKNESEKILASLLDMNTFSPSSLCYSS